MFLSIELDRKYRVQVSEVERKLAREKCVNCEDRWSKKSEMSEQKQNRLSEKKRTPCALARVVSDRPLDSVQIRETPVA